MAFVKVDHDNDPTTPPLTMKVGGDYPTPWLIHLVGLAGVYRFFLGRPMDNVIRTDATFWHRGTKGYPSRWLRLAGWERLVVRLFCLYLIGWLVVILAALAVATVVPWAGSKIGRTWPEPAWTQTFVWWKVLLWHIGSLVGLAVPVLIYVRVRDYGVRVLVPVLEVQRAQSLVRSRVHLAGWVPVEVQGRKVWELEHVRPVAIAAASVLALTTRPEDARRWVQVPRDFRDQGGSPVEIRLPANFTGADEGTKKRLAATVANRLGMKDPAVAWELAGSAPRMLVSQPQLPPKLVTWEDARDFFMRTEEYRPWLGATAGTEWLQAEMIADSPHIGLSAGSGAGKSELMKAIIMQALRWGWGVIILDWKEVSQDWADGLPGVRILRDIADIHDGLVELQEELDDRKKAYRQDRTLPGRAKVLVVYEEMNATSDLLQAYWQDLRATAEPEERKLMPTKSPALRAQNALVFGGRQFGLFCGFMAQRFSNRVTQGNTDVRENFAIKLMARYSQNTVKMLAPEIKPFPKKPTQVGGWVAVMGDQAVTFQAPLIPDDDAREYAMGGVENPITPLTRSYYPGLSAQQPNTASALEDQLGDRRTTPNQPLALPAVAATDILPPADPRKLSDMVDALEPLGITLAILQHAAKDPDSGFPPVIGGTRNKGWTYDFHMVTKWARKRHAGRAAEKVRR